MFHHKLGWQTFDQQDKAVSCEVGVLLVLASALQAELGWRVSFCRGILHCSGGCMVLRSLSPVITSQAPRPWAAMA